MAAWPARRRRRCRTCCNRDFRAIAPNQRWVADITEFPTGEGKLYLAGIRDLFHRGIVGWDTSGRQDAALVVSALTMALARTGNPAEVIHHADKGSQYTSLDFAFAAGNADMHLSFGSTGDAFDNAAMETFWARLKVEIAWIRGSIWFETRAAAHAYLFEFIEVFYNRQRHQAGLGHLTPAEYADKWRRDHEDLESVITPCPRNRVTFIPLDSMSFLLVVTRLCFMVVFSLLH